MTTPRIRWGLCCQFLDSPIRFRTATHRYVATLEPTARRAYLRAIARDNAAALSAAVTRCAELGIGAFRINSQILPLATHPESGYRLEDLDDDGSITAAFLEAGTLARARDVRLSLHPDQFVVLNSEQERVVASSVMEMDAQARVAQLVGADVLTLHGGGAAGGIPAALERLERGIERLPEAARMRLALENDDRSFTPAMLLPLCERLGVPLVYDVHHHRCNDDGLDVDAVSRRAAATWGVREPYFHISSPRAGSAGGDLRPHADYVSPADVPEIWRSMRLTVDVEAKAKERAVLALLDLDRRATPP
ncbi:MAG TPA: UV DNA damage repair endonuclease UvsE [Gemmatimonadaceae bacterium]|nr:UV DNA damage repair endonuclease UvsE [Gemmatimonadaceae bacterium]